MLVYSYIRFNHRNENNCFVNNLALCMKIYEKKSYLLSVILHLGHSLKNIIWKKYARNISMMAFYQ